MTNDTTAARRTLSVIGAPSSIGIRPYEEGGEPRRLDLAPGVLRELGLIRRLGARDLGDVTPPPYRDLTRPPGAIRNEDEVTAYSRALAERLAPAVGEGGFTLVLGGDCSILLGCLLGARQGARPGTGWGAGRGAPRLGLVYVDGHADFATAGESGTGSAAAMGLALAAGRGDSELARLGGPEPLVRGEDVVVVGRRDEGQPYGQAALSGHGVLDLPGPAVAALGTEAVVERTLERVARPGLEGFWIHVDADVLDPGVMPAVDSPEPGGPGLEELTALLRPLATHPKALGLELTIYDPGLDPDRSSGGRLVSLLEACLRRRSP